MEHIWFPHNRNVVQQSKFWVGSYVLMLEQADHGVDDYNYEEQATMGVSLPQFF
jgi:hypothetical protein